MTDISIYGGVLRSDVSFPGLAEGHDDPRWHLRTAREAPPAATLTKLGEDLVDPEVTVRLFRHAAGYRLVYDDTGTFDVLDRGARIDWYPSSDASIESARLDIIGRVLPLALHASGALCLHGSAVEIDGRGVAFLGPKRYGKSTLAQAVAHAGGTVMSDDVVAIDVDSGLAMRPGVRRVRLWRDAAARLEVIGRGTADAYGKIVVPAPSGVSEAGRLPIGAIYLLSPVASTAGGAAAARTPLPAVHAAVRLVSQARLAPLLGGREAGALLDRAVRLAQSAPVCTLEIERDLAHLPAAAELVWSWHARRRGLHAAVVRGVVDSAPA